MSSLFNISSCMSLCIQILTHIYLIRYNPSSRIFLLSFFIFFADNSMYYLMYMCIYVHMCVYIERIIHIPIVGDTAKYKEKNIDYLNTQREPPKENRC